MEVKQVVALTKGLTITETKTNDGTPTLAAQSVAHHPHGNTQVSALLQGQWYDGVAETFHGDETVAAGYLRAIQRSPALIGCSVRNWSAKAGEPSQTHGVHHSPASYVPFLFKLPLPELFRRFWG
ncbi:hypothetical protein KDA_50460 [Dictyobacter alpinus]|uniref:Uncharacterized protein n=1 Tax=Dictyobacter alpinus TaxID=2014873 RepID=A0A402BE41_9CHLR|nr:hypothetical protein [Dictyobacter alpinus]GCE29562.1 hypothetical protein KDA_50460 [Dictyobacter alpinus]